MFYLTPIQNPKSKVWYKVTPVGENTLAKTVKRLCGVAGIQGHKTNHSLRVTAATRVFHEGVDEQLTMERTGHKSLDGVRAYKLVPVKSSMGFYPPFSTPQPRRSRLISLPKRNLKKLMLISLSRTPLLSLTRILIKVLAGLLSWLQRRTCPMSTSLDAAMSL